MQNASFRKFRVLSLPEILDKWLPEQGEKSFFRSPQKMQKKTTIVKPRSKYSYVQKRVANVLSNGTLHWKRHCIWNMQQGNRERNSTLDLAKVKARCQQYLQPVLLRPSLLSCFNEEQRQYLEAKFNIGQESGMKVDTKLFRKKCGEHERPMASACLEYLYF